MEGLPFRHGRPAEVAYHRRAALPAGDPQVMVDRTVAAAEEALRVFAHEAAAAQCTAGLAAIGPYGSGGAVPRWQARLLNVLGQAQLQAGDPVGARQTLLDAYGLASSTGDPGLAAEGRCGKPRAFGAGDASGGMVMVEGRSDVLYELMESEQYRTLNSKAVMVADDFQAKLYYGGTDAELQQNMTIITQAGTELGYLSPVPQMYRDRLQRCTVRLIALRVAPAGVLLPRRPRWAALG